MVHQLIKEVDEFVVGRRSRRELETWVAGRLRQIMRSGDREAVELAEQIDTDFIDYWEGLLNERELRERLNGYVRRVDTLRIGEPATVSGVDAVTLHQRYETPDLLEPVTTFTFTHEFA